MQVADAIFKNNKITARELSSIANVTVRQIERIIASLKDKVGLRREGARKNGRWVFGE
jgi:predicted HTH transcriptional regulator